MAKPKSAQSALLCSTAFWGNAHGVFDPTTGTLRAGARKVARAAGYGPGELDRAERQLVKRGLAARPGPGTIALTPRGWKLAQRACRRVSLPPWVEDGVSTGSGKPAFRK